MSASLDSSSLISFLFELADAARAQTVPRWQSAGEARNKGDGENFDPVTEADVAAERAMRALIESRYPDHGIEGEEMERRLGRSRYRWSLDPIDGTRSYICGLPTWTTLVALLEDDEPFASLIDAPRLGERYVGCDGSARLVTQEGDTLIRTSDCQSLADARLSTTDPAMFAGAARTAFDRVQEATRVTRYGHDAYAYARLAAGSIDLVIESGLQPHDFQALIPVVCGAGGVIGGWKGDTDCSSGRIIAAASQALFDEAVGLLDCLRAEAEA